VAEEAFFEASLGKERDDAICDCAQQQQAASTGARSLPSLVSADPDPGSALLAEAFSGLHEDVQQRLEEATGDFLALSRAQDIVLSLVGNFDDGNREVTRFLRPQSFPNPLAEEFPMNDNGIHQAAAEAAVVAAAYDGH
jgi:hypothetical protein